jgi:DNA-binding LacI/PurR family transcriptional regulator
MNSAPVHPAEGFIYMEIASSLRGRIERGDFKRGRLPSERQLTAEFGVQRGTVRRALKELEAEGLVFRDTTRGTFARTGAAPGRRQAGIALVVGRAADTTAPGDIARGLSQVAYEAGRPVFWLDSPASSGHAEAAVPDANDLMARGVAAAVIWPEVPTPVEPLRALRAAMPLILLDRRVPGFESDFVGIDDFAAGRAVARHLVALGHRRVGFLSVAPGVWTVLERCRGYAAALAEAGVDARPEWTLHHDGDLTRADDEVLRSLIDGADGGPLTAVVCANDSVAAALIAALRRLGRRVPDDVAVTGFGNSFPQLLDALDLTTLAQPWEFIGRAAGELALRRLGGAAAPPPSVEEIYTPFEIVVRGSSGPVRRAG